MDQQKPDADADAEAEELDNVAFDSALDALRAVHAQEASAHRAEVNRLRVQIARLSRELLHETEKRKRLKLVCSRAMGALDESTRLLIQQQTPIATRSAPTTPAAPAATPLSSKRPATGLPTPRPEKKQNAIDTAAAFANSDDDVEEVRRPPSPDIRVAPPPPPLPPPSQPQQKAKATAPSPAKPKSHKVTAAAGATPQNAKAFAHVEKTVRKKSEREKLPGHDCEQCQHLYDETFGKGSAKSKDAKDDCSKHRAAYRRPLTQPHFWDTSMPSTETQEPHPPPPAPSQARQFTGAGVLPFAISPDDEVLLLMHKTTSGKKFGRLVEFGGHVEDVDAGNPAATAARELFEETAGKVHVSTEEIEGCGSVTNDRGYKLYFVGINYRDPSTLGAVPASPTGSKKREFTWVSLSSVLAKKTDLPLFERMTSAPGFYDALRDLPMQI